MCSNKKILCSLCLVMGLLVLPVGAFAQVQQQSKEPLLIQVYEDALKSRQNTEVELGACKLQVKDLQQQLQASATMKDMKEKK